MLGGSEASSSRPRLTVRVSSDDELNGLDPEATKLIVTANSCNNTATLLLPESLVDLEIQDNCLARCSSVQWKEHCSLRSIVIGNNCFTNPEETSLPVVFSICACPVLQSVIIGNNCFVNASLIIQGWLVLSMLPVDLKQLKEIIIGDTSFQCSRSMTVESRQ